MCSCVFENLLHQYLSLCHSHIIFAVFDVLNSRPLQYIDAKAELVLRTMTPQKPQILKLACCKSGAFYTIELVLLPCYIYKC